MLRAFALLALVSLFPQEDIRIKDWIQMLDDADLSIRDNALAELIKSGDKALPLLKEALSSESAEVRMRVEAAMKGIETARKQRDVYKEPKLITKSWTDAPVATIVDELAAESGIKIDKPVALEGNLTLKLEKVTLMQALDRICIAREKLNYDWTETGTIRLTGDRFTNYPSFYSGAFKIFVNSVEVNRTTDFKEAKLTLNMGVSSTWESTFKPLKHVKYEFTKVIDDLGAEISVVGFGSDLPGVGGMPAAMIFRVLGGAVEDPSNFKFSLKGMSAATKAIDKLIGTATYSFPLDYSPVLFEGPRSGDSQELREFRISIDGLKKKDCVDFSLAKVKGDGMGLDDEMDRRLDKTSFVAIDEAGKEHKADSVGPPTRDGAPGMIVVGPSIGNRPIKLRASFPTLTGAAIKSFKFRFIDQTFEKAVPFEIRDIKLP